MLNRLSQPLPAEVVPFREIEDGIFLMKRVSTKIPGAEHYGVLVTGEPLREFGIPGYDPIVIHRNPDLRVDWAKTTGNWNLVEQVRPDQIHVALERAWGVLNDPNYYLLTNNCEHTARYITSGEKSSTQVNWFLGIGAAAAIWLVTRNDN